MIHCPCDVNEFEITNTNFLSMAEFTIPRKNDTMGEN